MAGKSTVFAVVGRHTTICHLKLICFSWLILMQEDPSSWANATAVVAAAGAAAEDIHYWKSSSVYLWLLGYEFTGTSRVK
jgi:hypothetical protein